MSRLAKYNTAQQATLLKHLTLASDLERIVCMRTHLIKQFRSCKGKVRSGRTKIPDARAKAWYDLVLAVDVSRSRMRLEDVLMKEAASVDSGVLFQVYTHWNSDDFSDTKCTLFDEPAATLAFASMTPGNSLSKADEAMLNEFASHVHAMYGSVRAHVSDGIGKAKEGEMFEAAHCALAL